MNNYLTMRVGKCKFVIKQTYTDSSIEGLTGDDDKLLGFGIFTIPAAHRQPLIDEYGYEHLDRDMNVVFEDNWNEGCDYEGENADLFLYWLHWMTQNLKEYTLEVRSEHIFWAAHDLMHAKYDFTGSQFYCAPNEELHRYQQAYRILRRKKIRMDNEYLDRIAETFNANRFGCYGSYMSRRDQITARTIKSRERVYV